PHFATRNTFDFCLDFSLALHFPHAGSRQIPKPFKHPRLINWVPNSPFPDILEAMSLLSPRLQLKLAQKQILTPSLLQMVTVLQLNRLELKEMINQEIVENPVLEESLEEGEEITPEELQPLLEAERSAEPADQSLLDAADIKLD